MARLVLAALAMMAPAWAEAAPRVVADIPPVQALVARVMQGVGAPSALIEPGASPHHYALKPAQARALEDAQAVFIVGPGLTPWLMRPVAALAPHADVVTLMNAPGTLTLAGRTGATFPPHHHDDADKDHTGHDHAAGEGDDHPHGQGGDPANGQPEDSGHGEGDESGRTDPHAWLDPRNGRAWTRAIAAELSRIDPADAAAYAANETAALAEIDAAEADARAALAPLQNLRFVAFHDAYQYFEHRFGVTAIGSVSLGDASAPSPARIAALQHNIVALNVTCALAEPQFDPDLLDTVFEGTNVKTAVIDPLGSTIPAGPEFYPAFIRSLANSLGTCR